MSNINTALNNVDFFNQDGIAIDMLNDQSRNQFYKTILHECKDQHCIDIGFGTGLLSFIAVEHGAKSITAYEVVNETFLIGQHLIKKLNLEDKITLINKRFRSDREDVDGKVVFHEIVNASLWGEQLCSAITHNVNLIPQEYIMKVSSFEFDSVEQAFNQLVDYPSFIPGIDFKADYKNQLQSVIDQWVHVKPFHRLKNFDNVHQFRSTAKTIAGYTLALTPEGKFLRINDKNGKRNAELDSTVDLFIQSDKPQLVFCDFYMKHKDTFLHLNTCRGWGYPPDVQFLANTGITTLTHSFNNGVLTIT